MPASENEHHDHVDEGSSARPERTPGQDTPTRPMDSAAVASAQTHAARASGRQTPEPGHTGTPSAAETSPVADVDHAPATAYDWELGAGEQSRYVTPDSPTNEQHTESSRSGLHGHKGQPLGHSGESARASMVGPTVSTGEAPARVGQPFVGQIVNGLQWSGNMWIPVQTPSHMLPAPAYQQAPPQPPEPVVSQTSATRTVAVAVAGTVCFLAVLFFAWSFLNSNKGEAANTSPKPAATKSQAPRKDAAPAKGAPSDAKPVNAAPGKTTAADKQPEKKEPSGPVGTIGQAVKAGNFEFTIESVEKGPDQVGSGIIKLSPDGRYVLVKFRAVNHGDLPRVFANGDVQVFDAKDNKIGPDTKSALVARDGAPWVGAIGAGETLAGTLYFDVPTDYVIDRLEVNAGWFEEPITVKVK